MALSSPSALASPGYSPPSPSLNTCLPQWSSDREHQISARVQKEFDGRHDPSHVFRERTQDYVQPASASNVLLFDVSDTPPSPDHHMPHFFETQHMNKGRHAIGRNDLPLQKTRDLLGHLRRARLNADKLMVLNNYQESRLAKKSPQSWASNIKQEVLDAKQWGVVRSGR